MRVVVAMSGGVDSSVAAALVARAGHEAVGVTLKLSAEETGYGCCGSARDVEDARRVCESLGIRHYVMGMEELFRETVVDPFVAGYLGRRTPNPCVECNRSVKFGQLLRLVSAWNADRLATGHYARVEDGRLFSAADPAKDQSYFLCRLTRAELERAMFPVGDLTKPVVRDEARRLGLSVADKPESQEICFVPSRDYRAFVRVRGADQSGREGPILDAAGRRLGTHKGLENYTVGQRHGLGVSARAEVGSREPLYVIGMDEAANALIVGPDRATYRPALDLEDVSWISGPPAGPIDCSVRIRHRHSPAPGRVIPAGAEARVEFESPQRAAAPGQTAAFYRDGEVLGGGVIREALP